MGTWNCGIPACKEGIASIESAFPGGDGPLTGAVRSRGCRWPLLAGHRGKPATTDAAGMKSSGIMCVIFGMRYVQMHTPK